MLMTIEGESAGDVLTGAVVARTVEGRKTGEAHAPTGQGRCLNCGAQVSGAYCSACGQAVHLHRTLSSIGHDILHGVFHFEGKVWRTLPELFFHPGRLTRRYIDGERVKFVSPMALYLFTVFLMFAVFGMIGGPFFHGDTNTNLVRQDQTPRTKESLAGGIQELDAEIAETQAKLAAPDLSEEARADLESDLKATQVARDGLAAVAAGDVSKLIAGKESSATDEKSDGKGQLFSDDIKVNSGSKVLDERLSAGLRDVRDNPKFLLYKLKTNGYKFSWALIPLSLPFMWLLFFWRRDVHLYDHAIFVTYSITFMMLLLVIVSVLGALHVSGGLLSLAFFIVPIHMYKQLRGTYQLSRIGAFGRLILLLISALIVQSIFAVMLVALGVMG